MITIQELIESAEDLAVQYSQESEEVRGSFVAALHKLQAQVYHQEALLQSQRLVVPKEKVGFHLHVRALRKAGEVLVDDLRQLIKILQPDFTQRRYLEDAIRQIQVYGNDSLVHLCLPLREHNQLRRNATLNQSVSAVRRLVASGSRYQAFGIGPKGLEIIRQALLELDEERAQAQKSSES